MSEMKEVAFFYDAYSADAARLLLDKANIEVRMVNTEIRTVPSGGSAYRILVPAHDASKAERILQENKDAILSAGAEPNGPINKRDRALGYVRGAAIIAIVIWIGLAVYYPH